MAAASGDFVEEVIEDHGASGEIISPPGKIIFQYNVGWLQRLLFKAGCNVAPKQSQT